MTPVIDKQTQNALWQVALDLSRLVAPIGLKYFRALGLGVDNKLTDGFDPVTAADREIEKAIRQRLAEVRPDDAILGEEFGPKAGTSGLTWVIDPIDGTRAFIAGMPTWGTLIAVGPQSGPRLGLVSQPYIDECFIGGFGRAALIRAGQTSPIAVRSCSDLDQAVLFTTFPEVGTKAEEAAFRRVSAQCKLTRYGTDCYAYALLAAGQVDLVIEAGLNAYDIQGPLAVIEAAGGIVTDWTGGPAHQGGQVIAAGDARTHQAALKLLKAE